MVYVILLNWNGWKDTVQCLESVLKSDYRSYRVVVCDNDSTDGSVEKIKAWADGKLRVNVDGDVHESLKPLIRPGVGKPVSYVEYGRVEAEQGGSGQDSGIPLVLIRNGSNDGFSAGNNVGIRYAMVRDARYIWLLNNDTVIKPSAMKELAYLAQSEEKIGAAGAVIYYATEPGRIQTFGGGRLARLTGRDKFIREPERIDYVSGTSLFVKRDAMEQAGLMDERFFFYWEDVDFSQRIKKAGWNLAVAANASVYHKFSSTVGSQSLKSDLFRAASLTRYFRKHRKSWFFPVTFNISGMLANRIVRGQFNRLGPIIKETWNSIKH